MFAGLKEPEDSDDPAQKVYSKAKFMGTHCQGQTEVDVNGIGPTIRQNIMVTLNIDDCQKNMAVSLTRN